MEPKQASLFAENIKRIVWAIDPFDIETKIDRPTLLELAKWIKADEIKIDPVFIFTPVGEVERMATEKIEERIANFFVRLGLPVEKPQVILRSLESSRSQAEVLLDYAESTKSDLIFVSSRDRGAFSRLVFGSFIETLLNVSPLPILFLNRNPRPPGANLKSVLWPTDFSKTCHFAFDSFLFHASGLCKEITLFHDVSLPYELSLYFSQWDMSAPPIDEILDSQAAWASKESSKWSEAAQKLGYQVHSLVEQGHHHKVANEILKAAGTHGIGLIAMAAQRGPIGSMILGSRVREVFRVSQFPVWVYGTQYIDSRNETL